MVDGDESLVVWTDRQARADVHRIVLFGRVPTAALKSVSAAAVNAVVMGKVRASAPGQSLPDRLLVHARWGLRDVPFETQTTVTPDGSFRLVSPINGGTLAVWAEVPTERHVSRTEYVELAAGKRAEVVLQLAPEASAPADPPAE